jgi:hypothetical protein
MAGGVRYRFIGKPPVSFVVVFWLAMANFVAQFVAGDALSHGLAPSPWAQPLRVYKECAFSLHFLFLAILALTALIHRRQLVRVDDRPAIGARPASAVDLVVASAVAPAAIGFVGGMVTGAVYSQVSRPIGVLAGVLIAFTAAFVTDRLLVSFPESSLSPATRRRIAVWSLLVSGTVLLMVRELG